MRVTQLINYWTKEPATGADRERIIANIEKIRQEADNAPNESERLHCLFRIQILEGLHPPVRA